MRLIHYLEIENFKHFGDRQRIELDHPAVLIGPNNCGKTTAIQALALWSQAVRTWFEAKGKSRPKERPATSLNRLNIVSVPVRRTRYFWHDAVVRRGARDVPLTISAGVLHRNVVERVTMRFRNQGDELVYCVPDDATLHRPDIIETAAELNVELLYPMSGLETEEPILQPGRIDVLLGQGQTAQVLRNLCLLVFRDTPDHWRRIAGLMERLFSVRLDEPAETARGGIDLFYRQANVREPLDIALAGRGLQQMLLLLAYLHSHPRSVLLIDEPDAHLEILRQKQVYVLLREIAMQNKSQVVLVTHSEVLLDEALDRNLTLLLGGRTEDLAARQDVRSALRHYGAAHYVRAVERGYVLYVEGRTDLDVLLALAQRLDHSAADAWEQPINVFHVRDNHPDPDLDAEIERVEGGFGVTPRKHFFALREMAAGLRGLAILDNDGGAHEDADKGGLRVVHWKRYEIENYVVTPDVLRRAVAECYGETPLLADQAVETAETVLEALILERVFKGRRQDLTTWKQLDAAAARLLWEAWTERLKLSDFAEEFFRRLAEALGHAMLFRKGDLHRLVRHVDPASIPPEVAEKLDLLKALFDGAAPEEEQA